MTNVAGSRCPPLLGSFLPSLASLGLACIITDSRRDVAVTATFDWSACGPKPERAGSSWRIRSWGDSGPAGDVVGRSARDPERKSTGIAGRPLKARVPPTRFIRGREDSFHRLPNLIRAVAANLLKKSLLRSLQYCWRVELPRRPAATLRLRSSSIGRVMGWLEAFARMKSSIAVIASSIASSAGGLVQPQSAVRA